MFCFKFLTVILTVLYICATVPRGKANGGNLCFYCLVSNDQRNIM